MYMLCFVLQMVMLLSSASILWQFTEVWSYSCIWKGAFKISILCDEKTTLGEVQSRERQNAAGQEDHCFDTLSKVSAAFILEWNLYFLSGLKYYYFIIITWLENGSRNSSNMKENVQASNLI